MVAHTSALGRKEQEDNMPDSEILAQKKINWALWRWGFPSGLGQLRKQGLPGIQSKFRPPAQPNETPFK